MVLVYFSMQKPFGCERLMWVNVVVSLCLPARGRGFHLIPFRTQKLNRVPFPAVLWSSATRNRESWQHFLTFFLLAVLGCWKGLIQFIFRM